MEATMANRKAALLAALIAGILVTSGGLAMLRDSKGQASGPTPPQINALDLMSRAHDLADQTSKDLF
jgi:hypothetical protein